MYKLFKYCFLFLIAMAFSQVEAQSPTPKEVYYGTKMIERKFDEEKWKEITKDFDYSDALGRIDNVDDDSLYESSSQSRRIDNNSNNGGNAEFWKSLIKILLLIGIIAVSVYKLMGSENFFAPKNRKIQRSGPMYSVEDIEDNIHESDLELFIREAIDNKNYTLAIRGYYLAIIKELSLVKKIKWKRDKTNKDYLSEMRQNSLFQRFRETTRIFEKVWYGEDHLQEEEFLVLKPKFEQLIQAAHSGTGNSKSV